MKKSWCVLFCICTLVLFLTMSFAIAEEACENKTSYIAQHMELYGFHLPDSIVQKMKENFCTQDVSCGLINVQLKELLYDGQWLFTAISVSPANSDHILILPGSAEYNDRVCGDNMEALRSDQRTYLNAATEDNKRLIAVYAYIKEFDKLSAYFLDHFQEIHDTSILISGAEFPCETSPKEITWTIQLYDVNTETGKYSFISEYTCKQALTMLQPCDERTYMPKVKSSYVESITLKKTAVTTYVTAQWEDTQYDESYYIDLLDCNGKNIPYGAPPAANSFSISEFPQTLWVEIWQMDTMELVERIEVNIVK